jgi:hypothetical protein
MSTRNLNSRNNHKEDAKPDCMNPTAVYGYESPVDYGYGKEVDYGYEKTADDYGYENVDYGYGDQGPGSFVREQPAPPPAAAHGRRTSQHRTVRRNSCLVRKDANPLAVAEFLMGEPPRMSDRDLEAENSQQEVVA